MWVGDGSTPSPMRLLIIGPKRTGKSSVGNTLLGREAFDTWGGAGTTVACGQSEGRDLTVVDTYGWGMEEDVVPRQEKLQLLNAVLLCDPGPHVLLLVLPLLDFTRSNLYAVRRRMELLTEGVWKHTVVVFTLGDHLRGRSLKDYVQAGGEHLQWLVAKCQNRYTFLNNRAALDRKQVSSLLGRVEDVLLENGQWHFSLHMYRRLEEDWSRREKEFVEKMERRERRDSDGQMVFYERTLVIPKGVNNHG